ncbi:protein of unknown function DUF1657 [Desulfofarcimen acetoxidans DSM 771]|jgi:hypothetical protein|uniref:DUF1657 domain-containing protein n=1 Tax=Desulfofarcimen acetoxidans (strain ATCC 49208 / DSM 771 / KCTC 5769 / VKM B-1644 / 5575) TaxID=485916 RepID=C8W0D9_DESAS|nr:DUF1657 domain-containing protein [Desulfofarcimen acetoxidans]ACV63194.1 protein of unknown function DUF1657 [Desulfofarcimen acetoxidans DSM 771]
MTVASQLKQTMSVLKGTVNTLETFASYTENSEAKKVLDMNIEKINSVVKDFEDRIGLIEFEEPQYKGF